MLFGEVAVTPGFSRDCLSVRPCPDSERALGDHTRQCTHSLSHDSYITAAVGYGAEFSIDQPPLITKGS